MRLVRHPVAQYLLSGLVMLVAVGALTTWLAGRAADEEALAEARRTTEVLAAAVVAPAVPDGMASGDLGAIDRFGRAMGDRLGAGDVRRVKMWNEDGLIVYSDLPDLVGRTFALTSAQRRVLAEGGSAADISDLDRPENVEEADGQQLLEVYTRVLSPEGDPLLFEAYYPLAGVTARRDDYLGSFGPITLAGLGVFLLLTTPLLVVLTRRLQHASAERERLLTLAADASSAERRRIARDLHDGVVQDLAATAFRLSASARTPGVSSETRHEVEASGDAVRESLRSLRSLLVEIHPPDLRASGLLAALEDLTAPAAALGIRATVRATGTPTLQPHQAALVWRVAQEAVRNSLRHSGAESLTVDLTADDGLHRLVVQDDGCGFDPARVSPDRFGTRGLASLADDNGGTLVVESVPGSGTTVTLEVRS